MIRNEFMRKRRLFAALAAIAMIAAFLSSCSAQSGNGQETDKPNGQLKTVTLEAGDVQLTAEVAATDLDEDARFDVQEDRLADGKGMLFVFDSDQKVAFWMKNTSLPLSVAYIGSDGTIYQILDLVPFSEEPRSADRSVRYAIEVPQGWFAKVGLKPGDRFEIPALK